MPDSPSAKYGKVLFVFCGGGCKAVQQAVAAAEIVNAGFTPSHILSSSAGTCNALGFVEQPGPAGAEKTIRIWENYITSPDAIYEVHPFLREKLTRLLGVVPTATQACGPTGSMLHDVRRAIKFLPLVLAFCVRMPLRVAGRTVSFLFRLMDTFEAQQQSFRRLVQAPEIIEAFEEVDKYFEFKRMKAFLDPFPLLARLGEQIDLQKVLTSSIVWHIITERYEDGATVIFSNKDPDLLMDQQTDARSQKAKYDLFYKRIRASMALYPLFELVEMDGFRYLDADLANPLPVEEAFSLGCDTLFIFLNVPKRSVRVDPHPLRDLVELNDLLRLNERYIHHRLKEAQMKAKEAGINLFVIRPEQIPAGLGLLEIDSKVIELVKADERKRMKDYLADLDAHNLRFAPPLG
ncbi:MAG TPA: patatin-like phospholipase family protein [Nitrospira sp.]|jgi:predicted patatin/cPLA2 family phospholipase|nr:patatin-like phospholipase family protein [Nitrospira sp.]